MGLMERYRRSVALKVLIPQIIVIIVSLIIVIFDAVVGINGLKQQTIENEVKLIQTRMSTFVDMRKNIILVGTASLSKDSLITEAVVAGDAYQIQQLISNAKSSIFNQIMKVSNKSAGDTTVTLQVIDTNGRILASTSTKDKEGFVSQAVGENVSNQWAFRKMSATSGFLATLDYDKQGIVLRAVAPIVKDGRMIGVIQMIEDIEDTVKNYVLSNGFIYLLNLAPQYSSYAVNVKSNLYFNDGLVINDDEIDVRLLDVVKSWLK